MEEKDLQKQIETLFCSLCLLLKQCLACFSMKVHNSVTLISYFHRYQQDRSLIMFFFFLHSCRGSTHINNPYIWEAEQTEIKAEVD